MMPVEAGPIACSAPRLGATVAVKDQLEADDGGHQQNTLSCAIPSEFIGSPGQKPIRLTVRIVLQHRKKAPCGNHQVFVHGRPGRARRSRLGRHSASSAISSVIEMENWQSRLTAGIR